MKPVLIFLFCSISALLFAQQPDLVFHHLTEKDGLSYNIVNCFLKDSKGMLWIGTYDGLNRYDGAHFKVIRKGKDKNSLPNNTVHKLAEDRQGNLWGATDGGIFCYDPQTGNFKNYNTPGEKEWPAVGNILCDQQGVIWANSGRGLIRFNAVADSFELAKIAPIDTATFKVVNIHKNGLAESPDGKGFWITSRQGLLFYDKASRRFTSGRNNSDSILFCQKRSSGLCATSFGHYWYFDNARKNLVGFDPVAKKTKYIIRPKEFEKLYNVATVFEDNNHWIWVCTWGYQIYAVDYLHGNIVHEIRHDKNDRRSINGDFFWAVMHEPDGTLWLGTVGGISRCNTNHLFYKVHRFADSLFDATNPSIDFLSENKYDSSWWITTNKSALLHYTLPAGKISRFEFSKIPPGSTGLRPVNVSRMFFLPGRIFMFCVNGAWINKGGAGFKPLMIPGIPDSVILRDGVLLNDSVLYCTDNRSLWKCNLQTGEVNKLTYRQPTTINGEQPVIVFLTVAAGRLWALIGSDWLCYAEGNNLVPVKFSDMEKDGSNGYYTSMAADKKGNLWIAKKGDGLFSYNPLEKKYRQFKQFDGLVMDHVMTVSADNSGKIWSAAYNKFSVFNPILNSFYNFTLPLNENNFAYVNLMTTLASGNVICSVGNEIVEFYPEKLKTYSASTQPLISTLSVAGVEKLLPGSGAISLRPDENSMLIRFGLLADNESSPYDMLYILEGAEKNWTVAGSNFEASYNSLQPGTYYFKVKALAKDKSWQTKETVLKIHIDTPFYKSWWFIAMLAAAFASGIYLFYRYRLNQQQMVMQLESKAQLLEKEKTKVMYESLKQQLNPHFLFNSLTSLSGLIDTDAKMAGNFLEQMSKLYRYILKSSENETVSLKDEINFVKLFISLQQTRFGNGLEVNINVPEDYLHYKIAPVTLQNMIENAIKHNVIDAGSPLVIDIYIDEDYLVVKNNLQKKNIVETSNRQGITNLQSLYRYLSENPVIIREEPGFFAIKIPLI